jgi:DNA-binding NarL/FixJ family response regulator
LFSHFLQDRLEYVACFCCLINADSNAQGTRPLTYRVLVVDDYQPWRRYVCSALGEDPRWAVVGEASDGLDAVDKAGTLRPDVILLDINLPSLNGIKAARQIVAHDPGSIILFVSELRTYDIAKAALEAGGRGYVLKTDAPRELFAAMEAIVEGRRFIGRHMAQLHDAPKDTCCGQSQCRHEVEFYSNEALMLNDYARIAQSALQSGDTFMIVACQSRCEQLRQKLQARGIDVDRAISNGRYRAIDARETLGKFIVNNWPDEELFRQVSGEAASRPVERRPRVVLCGECGPTLFSDGNVEAAIRLEHMWDQCAAARSVDTLCGYLLSDDALARHAHVFEKIRAEHCQLRTI